MAKLNYAVLNATLIALVAIGGMVLHFSSGETTGAYDSRGIWKIGTFQDYYNIGDSQIGPQCKLDTTYSHSEWRQCCALKCNEYCNSIGIEQVPPNYVLEENEFKNCGKGCNQGCDYRIIRETSIGFNYRGVRDTTSDYRPGE